MWDCGSYREFWEAAVGWVGRPPPPTPPNNLPNLLMWDGVADRWGAGVGMRQPHHSHYQCRLHATLLPQGGPGAAAQIR